MVTQKSTVSPDSYRVDAVRDDLGNTRHVVMRCSPVASFNDPEHAHFLVALLQEGGAHHA